MLEASLNQIEQLVSDLMQKNAQLTEQNAALGQELAQAKVWKGTSEMVKAGLAEDLTLTLPKGQVEKLQGSLHMDPVLVAPLAKGAAVGKVDISLDGQVVKSVNLVALEAVEEGSLFRRLWDSIRLFFFQLFN